VLCTAIAVIKSEELTVHWSKGLHIFECVISNFSYFIGLNIYLFQIRTSFVKLISRNQHPTISVKLSPDVSDKNSY
jgi:hypothetical protein